MSGREEVDNPPSSGRKVERELYSLEDECELNVAIVDEFHYSRRKKSR